MSLKQFHRIFLLILCCSFVLNKQINIVRQNNNYVFKLDIGNLKINLDTTLSLKDKYSWIKSQQCQLCQQVSKNQQQKHKDSNFLQTFNDKTYDCSESCFGKSQQQYGLKCSQINKNCQIIKDNVEFQVQENKFKGKLISIKLKDQKNKQKIDDFQVVLVQKIYHTLKSLTDSSQLQKGLNNQIISQEINSILTQIGQYNIWGDQSIYESNIITKNNKQQIQVFDSLKDVSLQKQILTEVSPIEIQLQETVTKLKLTQAKFKQLITVNHPQKSLQDHQFAFLPLKQGFLTLQTQNLILPQKQFKKMTTYLAENYFSTPNNHCQFKQTNIQCEKSVQLDKIQSLQLQLILNGISVGFPFQTLLKNCSGKKCQTKLQISKDPNGFAIGTFLLDIFAIQLIEQTQNIKLYRLNNQWGSYYSKNQKYKKQNFNIFWWMGSSIFYIVYYVLKIIFYLAVFSLLVNCVYHWRKVLEWMGKILRKVANRNSNKDQGQLFDEEEQLQARDTSKLIKRFKNRRAKTFIEDQQISTDDHQSTQHENQAN